MNADSMSTDNSFHLVWDNYLENVSSLFQVLYRDDKLVDVTLACQDGFLKAHKLILSACSQYFERIFNENPCKHPVVIMRGVRYHEMQLILDYIYKGYVDIPGNILNNLICIASELEVKGFENFKGIGNTCCNSCSNGRNNCTEMRFGNETNDHEMDYEDTSVSEPESKSMRLMLKENQNSVEKIKISDVKSEAELVKTAFVCTICCYRFKSQDDLLVHQKIHIKTYKPHKCDFCFSSFTRASHLARHRRTHTGERPYQCLTCHRTFARQDKLKQHTRSSHPTDFRISPTFLGHEIESDEKSSPSGAFESTCNREQYNEFAREDEAPQETNLNIKKEEQKRQSILPSNRVKISKVVKEEKRGRGRPRKYPKVAQILPKRPRGRPRKVVSLANETSTRNEKTETTEKQDTLNLMSDISYLPMSNISTGSMSGLHIPNSSISDIPKLALDDTPKPVLNDTLNLSITDMPNSPIDHMPKSQITESLVLPIVPEQITVEPFIDLHKDQLSEEFENSYVTNESNEGQDMIAADNECSQLLSSTV